MIWSAMLSYRRKSVIARLVFTLMLLLGEPARCVILIYRERFVVAIARKGNKCNLCTDLSDMIILSCSPNISNLALFANFIARYQDGALVDSLVLIYFTIEESKQEKAGTQDAGLLPKFLRIHCQGGVLYL